MTSAIKVVNGTVDVGAKPKASTLPLATVAALTSSSSIGSSGAFSFALDTAPESAFDDVTAMCAELLEVQFVLVQS